jgi:ABC-type uncharacterized transport system permease subunit
MLISLILHSIFAIYIYGETELFSFHFSLVNINGKINVSDNDELETIWQHLSHRIKKCPFFVVFCLIVIGVLVLDFFIDSVMGASLKKKMFKDIKNDINKSYFENFKVISYNDFPKYDFRLSDE